jgi:hypothetical protein
MSVPMCGWNPHWGCTADALSALNIPIRLAYGAYWHQTMSNLLEDCIDGGLDWVVTLDYDSVFSPEQLNSLIGRFGSRSDVDALAALQCKRSTDEVPLMTTFGKRELEIATTTHTCRTCGTQSTMQRDLIRADTAHFGLTLIRLDALKRVPKPWMVGKPDANGSYRTLGRTDPDIAFWREWEKAGNTLYVDPDVAIGHLQPMVAEYDSNFNVIHSHVIDWRQRNRRDQVTK